MSNDPTTTTPTVVTAEATATPTLADQLRDVARQAIANGRSKCSLSEILYGSKQKTVRLNKFLTGKAGISLEVAQRLLSTLNLSITINPTAN